MVQSASRTAWSILWTNFRARPEVPGLEDRSNAAWLSDAQRAARGEEQWTENARERLGATVDGTGFPAPPRMMRSLSVHVGFAAGLGSVEILGEKQFALYAKFKIVRTVGYSFGAVKAMGLERMTLRFPAASIAVSQIWWRVPGHRLKWAEQMLCLSEIFPSRIGIM